MLLRPQAGDYATWRPGSDEVWLGGWNEDVRVINGNSGELLARLSGYSRVVFSKDGATAYAAYTMGGTVSPFLGKKFVHLW